MQEKLEKNIVFKLKGFHARMDLYKLMLIRTFLTENDNFILQHEILKQRTKIVQMKSASYSGD
jgi:hypothetical protein